MIRTILLVAATIAALTCPVPSKASVVLFDQPYGNDPSPVYASQYDSGGLGAFASTFDNFSVASPAEITSIDWTGGYFNGAPIPIVSFDLSFFADDAGKPGALIVTHNVLIGIYTHLDNPDGTVTYSSPIPAPFALNPGTKYWFSPVAIMHYPPQWGWAKSAVGDGHSYQYFQGFGSPYTANLAFTLRGNLVPEPGSFAMLGIGLVALAIVRARQNRSV